MAKTIPGMTSIIIPTFNNEQVFLHCIRSLLSFTNSNVEIHIVCNGNPYDLQIVSNGDIFFHFPGKNLGWTGGINYCKDKVRGEYVLFLNDDTQILDYDSQWLEKLKLGFYCSNFSNKFASVEYETVGAVGPTSNAVMGSQSISASKDVPHKMYTTTQLSGFCLLTRKEILDKVGWLDESLPGGDDLDFSFRLLDSGYRLAVKRDVFVYHRYATTGLRVNPKWDSLEHYEEIRNALIKKHGLKRWLEFERGNLEPTKKGETVNV